MATINAASLSLADVQSACDSASAGDTVVLPSGTAGWSGRLVWSAPANVTLKGAGTAALGGGDQTVITDNYGSNQSFINIGVATTGTFRMTGITVQGGNGVNKDAGLIKLDGPGTVRIDHCHIDTQSYSPSNNIKAMFVGNGIYGVMHDCILDLHSTSAVYVYNGAGTDGEGNTTWSEATGFGTDDFFFIEDCEVNGTPASHDSRVVDGFSAARFVIRYNTLTACCASEKHATGHAWDDRGTRAAEIYGNECFKAVGQTEPNYVLDDLSSGCALVWGNTASGVYKNQFVFNVTRKNNDTYNQTATPNGWGYAGTAFNGTGSNWDGNTDTSTGYPCIDQPGRGQGDLLTGDFPNKVNDTTDTIAWPNQALEPIYFWANVGSYDTGWGGSYYSNNSGNRVQADRDYYAQASGIQTSATSPFNGTTGCGWGTIANRPTTCTTGVGYWATDQNKLYKATATNTWTEYYSPYTYPHPLRSAALLAGPANVRWRPA